MNNPNEKPVILFVDGITYSQIKRENSKILSNSNIEVVNMESTNFVYFKSKLKLNIDPLNNSIYVLSPLSGGEYIELSESKYKIPMDLITTFFLRIFNIKYS